MNPKITEEFFQKLYLIPENKACFECEMANPSWASVNNGIFLCLNCSGLHRGFGVNVSFVRSVNMDTWSEKQLNHMMYGGNGKLRQFFKSYGIPEDAPIDFKYRTRAGQYYRDQLKALVENEIIPEPPRLEEALELLSYQNPNFPGNNQTPEYQGFGNQQPEQKKDYVGAFKGFMGVAYQKTAEVTKKTAEVTKQAYHKVNEKVKDPDFQEEVKRKTEAAGEKAKEIGQKSVTYAKIGFEGLKKGWGATMDYFSAKKGETTEINNKNMPEYFESSGETKK